MSAEFSADFSEIDDLNATLQRAIDQTPKERARLLEVTARKVEAAARSNAASYPHGTGALARSITTSGSALSRKVGADVREAAFLEFGSPKTGAPRPWLTGPAGIESRALLEALGKAAAPW